MKLFKYFIFALVFGYVGYWVQINLLLATFGQGKPPIEIVKNETLTNLIQEKTGLKLANLKVAESDRPFGMMTSIIGAPQMILSRRLYESFSNSETEYVILHEAGHYQLKHILKEWLLGLTLLAVGLALIKKLKNRTAIPVAAGLGLIFGVLMIQQGKIHELQADQYSLGRMDDPRGMIAATEKFSHYYGSKYSQNKHPMIQWLFYRSNPYAQRIIMAEEELKLRQR